MRRVLLNWSGFAATHINAAMTSTTESATSVSYEFLSRDKQKMKTHDAHLKRGGKGKKVV